MRKPAAMIGRDLCRLLLAVLVVLLTAVNVCADDLEGSRQRLDQIEEQIEQALKGLQSKQSEGGTLARDLERLDNETRRIERLARSSRQQLDELAARLEQQRALLRRLEEQRLQTERQVRHRLVVLYKTGEVGLIKALLSATESPREIAEKYAFLARMVRHDRELLDRYRRQAFDHQAAVDELEVLREKQATVVQRQRREQDTLQKAQRSKKVLLAKVRQDSELLAEMLQELRVKAARLNELVKKLETEQSQTYTGVPGGLLPNKGRLAWPVAGKLRVGFGTSRHGDLGTLIESHGFDIAAEVGSPVRAAAPGKVVFANSLRGYGNLMIVDHGSKYYTLYAHLASFAKQVGDSAGSDEVIGYSGHEGRDAVYFEIRQGGKPLNPAQWLKPR